MAIRNAFTSIGRGVVAGAAGTAVITAITMAEGKLRGKEDSTAPAEAMGKVLEVEPISEQGEQKLSNAAHWAYGTAWGAARGVLGSMGLRGAPATLTHFALVWGSALVMLPSLDIAPPASQWGGKELSIDALRHFAYSAAVNLAYEGMEG
jgi:hypothetical protein